MADYAPALKKLLREKGCRFDRPAKGGHEFWYSPPTYRKFVVTTRSSRATPPMRY